MNGHRSLVGSKTRLWLFLVAKANIRRQIEKMISVRGFAGWLPRCAIASRLALRTEFYLPVSSSRFLSASHKFRKQHMHLESCRDPTSEST